MILFFELLQMALGNRGELSRVPSSSEWQILLDEASRQSVVGVVNSGIERLPDSQLPEKPMRMQWVGLTQMTEVKNETTTRVCASLCGQFERDGFRVCVLKGQGNHRYYPDGMGKRRSCGDIDIWAVPAEGGVKQVLEYVGKRYVLTGLCWLHVSFDEANGLPVEVHFRPSFMNTPYRNRRFQKFFSNIEQCMCREEVDGVVLPVMKVEADVIYQMNHLYRHLLDEGVGMRQVVDYYFVLRRLFEINGGSSPEGIMRKVRQLGMRRFAGALMWVLGDVCAMPREWMLCDPSEKDGRFLLDEIMMAGNFGHDDPRMGTLDTSSVSRRRISQAWRRFNRNLRFLTSYPGEVFWEPLARLYHFVWKDFKIYNL